jgi:hypothetical protein
MGEDDGEVDLGATHALMAIPEPERTKYCIEVIKALADAAEEIAKMKGKIKQAKAAQEFLGDLKAKKNELLPVFFYVIKPEFRETVVELMERFSGYMEKKEE